MEETTTSKPSQGSTVCICASAGYCEIAGSNSSTDGSGKMNYRNYRIKNVNFDFYANLLCTLKQILVDRMVQLQQILQQLERLNK